MSLERGPVTLVTGGRHYMNWNHVNRVLQEVSPRCIVQGGAKGADALAKKWAETMGIPMIEVPANWSFYDSEAGSLRNGWMIEFVKVELVIAFPGKTGTANMVKQAKRAGAIDVRDERENS